MIELNFSSESWDGLFLHSVTIYFSFGLIMDDRQTMWLVVVYSRSTWNPYHVLTLRLQCFFFYLIFAIQNFTDTHLKFNLNIYQNATRFVTPHRRRWCPNTQIKAIGAITQFIFYGYQMSRMFPNHHCIFTRPNRGPMYRVQYPFMWTNGW